MQKAGLGEKFVVTEENLGTAEANSLWFLWGTGLSREGGQCFSGGEIGLGSNIFPVVSTTQF